MFPHSQTDLDFFLLQWKQMLLFVPVPAAVVVVVVVVADKDATTGLISLCGIPLIPYKPDVRLGTSGTPELVDTA
jgi:hypothetical protein